MAVIKTGLSYYKSDTDRYQDIKIKRLKRSFSGNGIAVYDYILNEVYRVQGCFLEWDENTAFDVAEYFGLKENLVDEIVKYCASVGLFDKELLCRGIITSRSIQERYLQACFQAKRKNVTIPAEIRLTEESENTPEESENTPEESENTPEESENTPEESENTPEVCDKEKKSKVKESKYNNPPPQEDINYNKSNTRERGGGQIKDIYAELCKKCPERADVWEAAAISNSFQNKFTEYYTQWLQLTDEQRAGYQLYQLNTVLRKECGDINLEWYNALYWCKDNLLQTQFCEIYTRLTAKPAALSDLTKLIKEVGKGKINNPGLFILSRLR